MVSVQSFAFEPRICRPHLPIRRFELPLLRLNILRERPVLSLQAPVLCRLRRREAGNARLCSALYLRDLLFKAYCTPFTFSTFRINLINLEGGGGGGKVRREDPLGVQMAFASV